MGFCKIVGDRGRYPSAQSVLVAVLANALLNFFSASTTFTRKKLIRLPGNVSESQRQVFSLASHFKIKSFSILTPETANTSYHLAALIL